MPKSKGLNFSQSFLMILLSIHFVRQRLSTRADRFEILVTLAGVSPAFFLSKKELGTKSHC